MTHQEKKDVPVIHSEDMKANQSAVKKYEQEVKKGKTDRELLDEWNEENEDIEYED